MGVGFGGMPAPIGGAIAILQATLYHQIAHRRPRTAFFPVEVFLYMLKSKPRILFVDDHDDTRSMVILWLGTLGYEVTATHSVGEGLRLARSGIFDLYLLDSRLADGDGKELCEKLREFDAATPIVFYAGDIFERVLADSDCQTQGFAMKPELEKLPGIISRALGPTHVSTSAI